MRDRGDRIALGIDGGTSETRHRLGLLVLDHHVDHPVLQCLERADRYAELLARLQVIERRVVGGLDRADGFGAYQRGREIDDLLDQRQRAIRRADESVGADANVVERDIRCARCIEHPQRANRHARRIARDEQEADAVGVAVAAAGAHGYHQHVGGRGVRNGLLDA